MTVCIVLNYNDFSTTFEYIEHIKTYCAYDKIIVVDNCSTDESWIKLSSIKISNVDLIRSESNRGYAAGNNIGIRYAIDNYPECTKIVISNPDIIVSEADVDKILDSLDAGYGMATGVIYNYNRLDKTSVLASNFAWRLPNYCDMLANCFLVVYKIKRLLGRGIYLNYEKHKDEQFIECEAVPGCFFAIRTEIIKNIGFFDERTFLFGEETIMGFKLRYNNIKTCVVNNTKIFHENSVSINKSLRSALPKAKILLASYLIYIKYYLRKSGFHQFIFRIIYWIGFLGNKLLIFK